MTIATKTRPLPLFNLDVNTKSSHHSIAKHCEICGTPFIDSSCNHIKSTCSEKCRRILYDQKDPAKKTRHLIDMRFNVLALKGVIISPEEKEEITGKLQAGKCEICGRVVPWRKLCIDHDHKTMRVRGVICDNCNYVLGHAEDDPERLAKAIEYLNERRE